MKNPNRVAAGKRSKAKGATWQREVAVILSEWSGLPWKSTPRSGGLRWGGIYWTYGDLVPPEDVYVLVECKHYHQVHFLDVLGSNHAAPGAGHVANWWHDEAVPDSQRATVELDRYVLPLLIWKWDFNSPKLTLDLDVFNRISEFSLVTVTTGVPGRSFYVTVDLSDFLSVVDLDRLIRRSS